MVPNMVFGDSWKWVLCSLNFFLCSFKFTKIATVRYIDLFGLSILFCQYRSCDDPQESIDFQSWTFSCSHAVFLMNTTKVQTSWGSSHDLYWGNKKACCCNKSYLESHSALRLNFTERKISEIRCFLKTLWSEAFGNSSFIWLKGNAQNWR